MSYSVDEILLLENITYIPNDAPLISPLAMAGKTVREYMDLIDLDALVDEKNYASFYNGFDWKNTLTAIRKNASLMDAKIVDAHADFAYGGGGGVAVVFVSEKHQEAVVAFRGTATLEWADDMEGAAVTDTLQQINALEYFRTVVRRHDLERYKITVTGHSKGGNKAKYITVLDDTPDRCVSFDGQGFSDKFIYHYSERIKKRQSVIHNHNVDYDFVNFILNDIGEATFYHGYDYGHGGFAEAHCPNTFFDFHELGEYTMRPNPSGQSTEIQLLDQFLSSMLRSMPNDMELGESAELIGELVQHSVVSKQSEEDPIRYGFNLVTNPKYSDNVAFMIAFFINYERLHPGFINTIGGILTHFGMDDLLRYIDIVRSVLEWKRLDAVMGLTTFVVGHFPSPILKQLQKYLQAKLGLELDKVQLRAVLSVVTMAYEAMKTMNIVDDGTDLVVDGDETPERNGTKKEDSVDILEIHEKLDILILAGGLSPERNISLLTGYNVLESLRKMGHRVILMDSYLGYGTLSTDLSDPFERADEVSLQKVVEADTVPDLWAVKKRRRDNDTSLLGPNVIKFCRMADLIFVALPGSGIETGKIQGLLDLYGLDYTGSSARTTTIAMNKSIAKQIFAANHIKTPKWVVLKKEENEKHSLPEGLSYPVVVKPNTGGASIGVAAVNDDIAFGLALNDAFQWEDEVVIEEYIAGREFSVAVVGDEVYPVLEVNGKDGVYDAKHSLTQAGNDANCPADLTKEQAEMMKRTALQIAKVIGITNYCRVDFRMNTLDELYCLECDALPSFTKKSRFTRALAAGGVDFDQMVEKIVQMSLKKK